MKRQTWRSAGGRFGGSGEPIDAGRGVRVTLAGSDGRALAWREIVSLWQHDEELRELFIGILREAPWEAFFWETPPVASSSLDRPFEFVTLDAPGLAAGADPAPFESQLGDGRGSQEVRTFRNLGGDALLVAPCQAGPLSAYAHLARFVRAAPGAQVHALWQTVGRALEREVTHRRVWVSTAGGGVAWLHVRLDSTPKYYAFAAYRACGP